MKISYFIFLSFFTILFLFSLTTYINYKQSQAVQENTQFITTSTDIVRSSGRFQRNILNMVSGLRGYLLTGENYFMTSYDSAAFENETILTELSGLIPDESVQERNLQEIQALNLRWVEEFGEPLRQAKLLSIVNDSNLDNFKRIYKEKILTGKEKQLQQELQERFRQFSAYEYDLRTAKKDELASSVQKTKNLSFILTALSIVISFVIVGYLTYRISTRIRTMVRLANEISAGNYNVTIADKGNDELSVLSGSLNHMANVLSENISLLQSKNKELDQFAHIVSHDLKGPLRGIDNVISWIEEDHAHELSPKVKDYLGLIKGRVYRGENLIEGILSYARIDKETLQQEKVDVTELIHEVVESVVMRPEVQVVVEGALPVILTEKIFLFQVFSNLISNAIKYNDKENGVVKIYYEDHHGHYEFFVADNGPGISQIYHDRIFLIFQTLKERDSMESTGVGLAIVKKILDSRKETINIASEANKGTVFSFTWKK